MRHSCVVSVLNGLVLIHTRIFYMLPTLYVYLFVHNKLFPSPNLFDVVTSLSSFLHATYTLLLF